MARRVILDEADAAIDIHKNRGSIVKYLRKSGGICLISKDGNIFYHLAIIRRLTGKFSILPLSKA
jgi:hypothetical protein